MHRIYYLALAAAFCANPGRAAAQAYWENGDFSFPAPNPGGFELVDTGERYGEWIAVGEAGNVSWVTGQYIHDGFSFVAPPRMKNWVNLAGISRTATGIMHSPVPTVVGQPYTLTYYVGNIVDPKGFYGTSSTINIYENSRLIMTATNGGGSGTATENWKPFTLTFTADAPWTSIAFINADPPNDMNCGLGDPIFAPAAVTTQTKFGNKGGRP